MNAINTITRTAGLAAALLLAASPQAVWAVASNTAVNNTATVDYEVNSVAQPTASDSANFVVDKKVDVLVENLDGAAVLVAPNQQTVVLKFRVTNQGNDVQDILLAHTALSGAAAKYGGTDNFDIASFKVYQDDGNGTWDGTGTETDISTPLYIDELAAGSNKVVYLVGNVPVSQADGSIASYFLDAQVATGGGAAAKGTAETSDAQGGDLTPDAAGTVQIVFADDAGDNSDTARNGRHTLQGEWKVASATIAVTKSSVVISDGVSASNFKRIPGAVVEYIIDIQNSGGTAATNVIFKDDLSGELTDITFATAIADYSNKEIQVIADYGNTNVTTDYTSASDGDTADYGTTQANTVYVSGLTVAAGTTTRIKFRVTID